ncbi:glucodextranase DOMON-like domain-containing protein [Deinococcus cellulosilyticus]|uniref:Glucodextranase-like C-terminal domain-containing protein n=1 Tax=Deinococcus cellulosilyticus (strain DSM 18568 / NBRC 106333 / KACC 11606 / 5516J-15) TaxID=1223518 RepID=A0A511N292_DEIC1|nr:glucodextranase DOMON-like domain-containing protein [Deinococcus cellulosilyticus]GEM46627.1 hypothetical protein DC3_22620 [Deinococcus cellulosilyticus NBRC 106333 = KACC 11606]
MDAPVLLFVADPAGDQRGDGGYLLPGTLSNLEVASLDLRSFAVRNEGGNLKLEVGMAALENPLRAPVGFSVAVLDVFIKTAPGGDERLADTGFVTPSNQGWQHHLSISPLKSTFQKWDPSGGVEVQEGAFQVQTQGTTVHISTSLPAGQYQYWVMVSVFDPLTPTGVEAPSLGGNPSHLRSSLQNAPVPVDVLLAGEQQPVYREGTLPAVGRFRDGRPWWLLLLGGIGMAGAFWATLQLWRRENR